MKIKIKSLNGSVKPLEISLTKNDFVSSGGEGEVYKKGDTAYKIYYDTSKIISKDKIYELSEINNSNIINPKEFIVDNKLKLIGYTMRYLQDTYSMCQLFNRAFRDRNSIDHYQIQNLIKKLHNIVSAVHSAGILIVDLNEMNFLISSGFNEVFAIDTDSYQTKSYKATAIMESIRDRHCNNVFSKETDWFSYGIITFQMFTGIHPYKGRHDDIKSIDERMKKNISVFNKEVRVPKACYDFNVIPESYLQWYKAIFDDGKRVAPPDSFDPVIVNIIVDTIYGTDNIILELINEYDGTITNVDSSWGTKVLTDKYFYKSKHLKYRINNGSKSFSTPLGVSLLAKIDNEKVKIFNIDTEKELPCTVSGSALMTYGNVLYVKSIDKVIRINTFEINNNILITTNVAATILENASKFFDGVLIQNMLGAFYVSIFPSEKSHHQIKINEFDGHTIVDAKYDNQVLMAITINKSGIYDKYIFRFSNDFKSYDTRKIENISPVGINFVVLDNGVTVSINDDEDLELFSNKKDSKEIKIVQDRSISNIKLFKSGAKLLFAKENKLYHAKMK